MVAISTPQAKIPESSLPQVEDKEIFKKKEHKAISGAFLSTFENPEKQTRQYIQNVQTNLANLPEGKPTDPYTECLNELEGELARLQNPNEKKIFTFMSGNVKNIFNNINPKDIEPLSEEHFSQLLLSVYKRIREENLASEKNLKNGEIQQVVDECVTEIRGTEAKESLIKLIGWPLGVKIDPKNIFGSIKDGLLEKVPFLGKGKEEEKEKPLSDEQMVTQFLRKSLLPIALFALTLLIFGGGPIMTPIAVIGLIITEVKAVKSLSSNDKEGTLYDPYTTPEEKIDWDNKILNGINDILKTPAKGEQPDRQANEQVKIIPEVAQSQGTTKSWTEVEDQRKQHNAANSLRSSRLF